VQHPEKQVKDTFSKSLSDIFRSTLQPHIVVTEVYYWHQRIFDGGATVNPIPSAALLISD
jgi:hypothetical protein